MPVQPGTVEYCSELLSRVGTVHGKSMFGGYGLYVDDVFVAIIVGETLYLKADAESRAKFEQAGCTQFEYEMNGKTQAMGYWTVPPEAMDSARNMEPWAKLAVEAALRAKDKKRKKPR